MTTLRLSERGPDYVIATIGTLYVTVCHRTPSMAILDAIDRTETAFLASVKVPIRSLTVIRHVVLEAPPDAAFRTKSADLMKKYAPSLVGTAQVFEGAGFGTSLIRAFVTGVTALSRNQAPTKAFGAVDASLEWLCGLGKPDPALSDRAAVTAAIAALEPGPPA